MKLSVFIVFLNIFPEKNYDEENYEAVKHVG